MAVSEPGGHGVSAEPNRVSGRLVARFSLAVAVLSVAAILLMVALFHWLERGARIRDAAAAEAAGLEQAPERLPPQPRLQINGARHWREFRSSEEEQLESYGWIDRANGVVHIPISRAIDLVASRGVGALPPGPGAPTPAAPAASGARP